MPARELAHHVLANEWGDQDGLIVHLDPRLEELVWDFQIPEGLEHARPLYLGVLVRDIYDHHEGIALERLLQRRVEAVYQPVRQILDESDRIDDEYVAAVGQSPHRRMGVEGRKQGVTRPPGLPLRPSQAGVEERLT